MDYKKTLYKYCKNKKVDFGTAHNNPHKLKYKYFIIIPAYSEYEYLFKTLKTINNQNLSLLDDLLVVVVINNSNKDNKNIINNNILTYNTLIKKKYKYEFIAIDSFSKNFALDDQIAGVGMARKIGMDYCIQYSFQDSLFCSLDSDTLIADNYLEVVSNQFKNNKFSTAVINFTHQLNDTPKINTIIKKYEKLLKKIARQIHDTGSPYGYVSMGSTIVCSCKAYIAIGGIQPLKATEDFYFLQQLVKYKSIHKIKDVLVYPSSRSEQRVYLGTGYRIKNFSKNNNFQDLDIMQEGFDHLKSIYIIIDEHWHLCSDRICKLFKSVNPSIDKFMRNNDFVSIFDKIKKNTDNKKQCKSQFNNWFDNLKIYKFLKIYVRN